MLTRPAELGPARRRRQAPRRERRRRKEGRQGQGREEGCARLGRLGGRVRGSPQEGRHQGTFSLPPLYRDSILNLDAPQAAPKPRAPKKEAVALPSDDDEDIAAPAPVVVAKEAIKKAPAKPKVVKKRASVELDDSDDGSVKAPKKAPAAKKAKVRLGRFLTSPTCSLTCYPILQVVKPASEEDDDDDIFSRPLKAPPPKPKSPKVHKPAIVDSDSEIEIEPAPKKAAPKKAAAVKTAPVKRAPVAKKVGLAFLFAAGTQAHTSGSTGKEGRLGRRRRLWRWRLGARRRARRSHRARRLEAAEGVRPRRVGRRRGVGAGARRLDGRGRVGPLRRVGLDGPLSLVPQPLSEYPPQSPPTSFFLSVLLSYDHAFGRLAIRRRFTNFCEPARPHSLSLSPSH